jgi:hypothetical protein
MAGDSNYVQTMVMLLCLAITTQWRSKTASQGAAAITALRDNRSQHISNMHNYHRAKDFTIFLQRHASRHKN